MTTLHPSNADDTELPEAVRAEAAVWVAMLHSDERSEQLERNFRAWLAESPVHAAAFERMTNTWETTAGLQRVSSPRETPLAHEVQPIRRRTFAIAAVAAFCAVIASAVLQLPLGRSTASDVIATAVGERRSLQLGDGSRLVLNTNTRVSVAFDSAARVITLQKGQVRFEAAPDSARPFIVRVGGKQIVARGTQFDVRWTDERLAVVLFEGRVSVLPAKESVDLAGIMLEPGERLYFEQPTIAVKSMPSLAREEAWLAGRAIFDHTPLREALAEMNRYAQHPLELADATLADVPISGTFFVDDVEAFARALGDMLMLDVEHTDSSILLRKRWSG